MDSLTLIILLAISVSILVIGAVFFSVRWLLVSLFFRSSHHKIFARREVFDSVPFPDPVATDVDDSRLIIVDLEPPIHSRRLSVIDFPGNIEPRCRRHGVPFNVCGCKEE